MENPIDWLNNNKDLFSIELNGYSGIPVGAYVSTLSLIFNSGKILDLGSGNGALLLFLTKFSKKKLEPYGVDIKDTVIEEAKKLLPEYENNFIAGNVNEIRLDEKFNIIITNPFYGKPNISNYVNKCLDMLTNDGYLLFRVHRDVLKHNDIGSMIENADLAKFDIRISTGVGLELGILEKSSQHRL